MISLFLTALLGLFCCSSINYNALDHTKEIEVRENNIKSIADYNGEIYLTTISDYMSVDFLKSLIDYSVEYLGVAFRDGTNNAYTISFSGFNTSLCYLNEIDYNTPSGTTRVTSLNSITFDSQFSQNYQVYYVNFHFNSSANDFYLTFYDYFTLDTTNPDSAELSGRLLNTTCRYNSNSGFVNYYRLGFIFNRSDYWDSSFETNYNGRWFVINPPENYVANQGTYQKGWTDGYSQGVSNGRNSGFTDGYREGKQDGYDEALQEFTYDDTIMTIFTGCIDVGLLPVNIFLQILNFEVFGINIAGFVSSLLTIAIVVIVIRLVTGKKDD